MKPRLHLKPEVPDGLSAAVLAGSMTDTAWYDGWCGSVRYSVLISRDDLTFGRNLPPDWRWHISVAGQAAVPRWRDFVALVHHLRPGIFFALGIPPRNMWMSLHPYTLHAMELRDDNLIEQWRFEGRFARSTPT